MSTEIDAKYQELGGEAGFLGKPQDAELPTSDGRGRFRPFQGGAIYWSSDTGAHEVHGLIRENWALNGSERGPLGYPTEDEKRTADGVGRYSTFEAGACYWTPTTGAHEVYGEIGRKYLELDGPASFLGYPLTGEAGAPDHAGRFNHFENGSIYWKPGLGAHEVHGAIRGRWADLGWERGLLGYPISDEHDGIGDIERASDFQGGSIAWSKNSGPTERVTALGYRITLERFHIDNTRALDDDTDVVAFTVETPGATHAPGTGSRQARYGNVDDGDHPVGWSFGDIGLANAAQRVRLSYSIANAGYADSDSKKVGELLKGLGNLCSALCAGVFGFTGVWATVATKFSQYVGELLDVDCDGGVAADVIDLAVGDLHNLTAAKGVYQETRSYPGSDSAWRCGSNSHYTVTWSVTYVPPLGPVE
jgi:uncharacterized protein with LGFP repeats